jgi:hypothetical protein
MWEMELTNVRRILIMTIAIFTLTSVKGWASFSVVQSTDAAVIASNTCAGKFASNVTAGDAICACGGYAGGTANVTSVTDSNAGDTYILIKNNASTAGQPGVAAYCTKSSSGGVVTVTVNYTAPTSAACTFSEISGNSHFTLDVTTGALATGTNPTTGNMTTTQANEFILGCMNSQGNNNATAGSGYTLAVSKANMTGINTNYLEYKTLASAGTTTISFTNGTSETYDISGGGLYNGPNLTYVGDGL